MLDSLSRLAACGCARVESLFRAETGASQEPDRALRHDGGVGGDSLAASISVQVVRGDCRCVSLQSRPVHAGDYCWTWLSVPARGLLRGALWCGSETDPCEILSVDWIGTGGWYRTFCDREAVDQPSQPGC